MLKDNENNTVCNLDMAIISVFNNKQIFNDSKMIYMHYDNGNM